MLLNDKQITKLATEQEMIAPFLPSLVRTVEGTTIGALSYGISSFGYDMRLGNEGEIFCAKGIEGVEVDPKRPNTTHVSKALLHTDDKTGEQYFVIPPLGYFLGHTLEYLKMPRNVTCIVMGKSTYARSLLLVNVTPIEAGFEGQVVIEIANPTMFSVRVYVNEGIAQFLYLTGDECEVSYKDRDGKYQGQTGLTHSRV